MLLLYVGTAIITGNNTAATSTYTSTDRTIHSTTTTIAKNTRNKNISLPILRLFIAILYALLETDIISLPQYACFCRNEKSIFFIILTIFRFPYALLISVLTTITALIPIFGGFIAIVIGAILIATVNPIQALIFVVVFLIIQQVEGNLIYPKVVGKSVGLSPIWTLLAISVGGSIFGIVGMLIGLPVASIIYALIKKDVINRLGKINK